MRSHDNRLKVDTELERAQAELRLYKAALAHTNQGICLLDQDDQIAILNRRFTEIFEFSRDQSRPGAIERGPTGSGLESDLQDAKVSAGSELDLLRRLAAGNTPTIVRGNQTYRVSVSTEPDGLRFVSLDQITKETITQQEREASESRLTAMINAIPDCVKIFDEQANIVSINQSGLDVLQVSSCEALNDGPPFVPSDHAPRCIEIHSRVLAGESVIWNYEIIGRKGRRASMEARSVPFRLGDGARAHLCISRDCTERKKAEQRLRQGEERLRLIQEVAQLADFETIGDQIFCSEQYFRQVGLPPVEVMSSEECLQLVHPDDRQRVEAEVLEGLANADVFETEYRIIRPDTQEERWMLCRTRVQRDEFNEPVSTLGAQMDITDRKRSEELLRRNEERLRLVHDATGLADYETGSNSVSVCSDRFFAQVGLPVGDHTIDFHDWISCVHPLDRDRLAREVEAALAEKDDFSSEFRIVHAQSGEVRWISSRSKVIRDGSGKLIRTVGAHLDITERKLAEQALAESEERFRLAAEAAGLGIWDYDTNSQTRQWSPRLLSILGLSPTTEPTWSIAINCVHPDDRVVFTQQMTELLHAQDQGSFAANIRILRANDNVERWISVNGWKRLNTANGASRVIVTIRDATDERTATERVRWSANHDPLTGLANRRLFQNRLDQAVANAEATGCSAGLLLLDLDDFKRVNDALGHEGGDNLLKLFAERLRSLVRSGDTVCRFGGDEFAIILPQLDREHRVAELAQAILERLHEPFNHDGRVFDCRASIGASIYPKDGPSVEELLKNADIALYSAKSAGRAKAVSFEPHLRNEVRRRSKMIELGRDAVRDDRIIPYYQPKLDLRKGSVAGFEALLRWRDSKGRIHHPNTIETAFEDATVAAEISDRMIERAIADARSWLEKGIRFGHIAVNASAAEFRQDNFAERFLDRLRKADIPTWHFQLEVTETVFLGRGAESVHRALAVLSSAGIKIALDDFGTGYASLRHLKQFPIDIIKIDRSFVSDMNNDPGDEAIVRGVINLGQNLGIKVVAEGIETQAQAEHLTKLGCNYGQGFLFSKAVHANRVPQLSSLSMPAALATAPANATARLRLVTNR